MRIVLFTIISLAMEMAAGTETAGILRCRHESTKAITYTTDRCPVGMTEVRRLERGGFVGSGEERARSMVTVCRMDSRFDSFRYIHEGDCPFGSSPVATYANATIEEARQRFSATWRSSQESGAERSATRSSRRATIRQTTADCHFLRQQRDKVQARLNNNKAYQDDLQRLRDAQDAIAREGCRSFGD